jgi:hypothetical protein
MVSSHPNHVDASQSTFNDVACNQTINNNVHINCHTIINVLLSGAQTLHHLLPSPGSLLHGVDPKSHLSAVISLVNVAVGLITNTVHLLHAKPCQEYLHTYGVRVEIFMPITNLHLICHSSL